MTPEELQILDVIQDGFPIANRPYEVLAQTLGSPWTETSAFAVVENLRKSGVIRRLGGVYDSRKLGFVSRLCAGVVPCVSNGAKDDSLLDTFTYFVRKIPCVTHNYLRSHDYNVWFTIIQESEDAIDETVKNLMESTRVRNVHIIKPRRFFKINTVMNFEKSRSELEPRIRKVDCEKNTLEKSDRLRIYLLSGDMPHTLEPYADLCNQVGLNLDEFLDGIRNDIAFCRMRRLGAVLRHQEAGFSSNAMVCFDIPSESECISAGNILKENPHVSHSYEREPFENFDYNLYAMFHAESREKLDEYIADAVSELGNPEYAILHSLRELKKTSFRFFENC